MLSIFKEIKESLSSLSLCKSFVNKSAVWQTEVDKDRRKLWDEVEALKCELLKAKKQIEDQDLDIDSLKAKSNSLVEQTLSSELYNKLIKKATIAARRQVLSELTESLLWSHKQEVFDSAAQVLASDQFLRDHYPKLVTALALELKKTLYLVPLAREVAKQPELRNKAAEYLTYKISSALSADQNTWSASLVKDNTTNIPD